MSVTTQSTTPATLPNGTKLALDVVGTPSAPATGDGLAYTKLDIGVAGSSSPVTAANPMPVTLATNAPDVVDRSGRLLGHVTVDSAPSTAVTNAGTFAVQATGTVGVNNFPATQPVSIAASVAVTGPLTDAQLRASAVPVSGTVATGGLTDAQLRASAVTVSLATNTPDVTDRSARLLGTIANTSFTATQATGTNLHVVVDSAPTTAVTATALPLPAGAALEAGNLAALVQYNAGVQADLLTAVLRELRITNYLLQSGLNVSDDLDLFRADPSYSLVS